MLMLAASFKELDIFKNIKIEISLYFFKQFIQSSLSRNVFTFLDEFSQIFEKGASGRGIQEDGLVLLRSKCCCATSQSFVV